MEKDVMFSVIIPVYNAERSLNELCNRITNVFEHSVKRKFEIILVNDMSKDNSWEKMQEIHQENQRVKIINLAKNCGQHSAIMCGLNNFKGDFVILMDDDLQHYPEEIPKLINEIEKNDDIDVVIGSFNKKKHSFIRNLGSRIMQITGKILYKSKGDFRFTNFRILRANIARIISLIKVDRPRIGQLILYTTGKISSVPVDHDDRKYGKSGYTFLRLAKDFLLNIINNSSLPLRLISYLGVGISFISFVIGIYYLVRYISFGTTVQGWTSLMVITTFLLGFVLLALGIIGEYLIRILKENYKLPNYIEREKFL